MTAIGRSLMLPVFVAALAGSVGKPKLVAASTDRIELVAQPFASDAGLTAIDVPIVTEGSPWDGVGFSVEMTAKAIPILTTFRGMEVRNAAALEGLKIRIIRNEARSTNEHPPGLFGDTLRAELDLTGYHTDSIFGFRPETLVPATVQCILENARRSADLFKYLDLRIRGRRKFARHQRVYQVKNLPKLSVPGQLD